MVLKNDGRKFKTSVSGMINEKMKVLEDFNICDRHDKVMRKKLRDAIESKPEKDPREILDYVCRPLIHAKLNESNL